MTQTPAEVAAAADGTGTAPTLRSILEPLLDIPSDERKFSCRNLLKCLEQLECVEEALLNRKAPAEETLADQDRVLLTWLCAYYHGISGSQSIIHGDLLEAELTASGLVAPFVQPTSPLPHEEGQEAQEVPAGGARFGVPTNISPEVVCSSVSELVRMAAAALISLYVYLNFKQGPDDLAADEVLLVYSTITIHSCANADNAAALDQQMQAITAADLEQRGQLSVWRQQQQQQLLAAVEDAAAGEGASAGVPETVQFGCAQIRWLMHYVRGLVAHHMAAVHHLLGQREKQAECYMAQQKDMQSMCKALAQHPLGYSLFARCCMNNQQMGVAAAFLERGLAAAQAVGHDAAICQMSFQRAGALLLGGAGKTVDAAVVQQLIQQGEEARVSLLSWWPESWRAHAADGEPDRTLVLQKLLPEFKKRQGQQLPAEGDVEALHGLLYVTKAPSAIPPGALVQLEGQQEGQRQAPLPRGL